MTGLVIRCWFGTSVSTPSRSRTTTYRPRSSCTQPNPSVLVPVAPVKLMTSPGLIERSINSTKPLTKFAAIACRPKPRPMPIAPVSTFSVVRSRPEALRPSRIDRPIRNACANFEMPMRIDSAKPCIDISRRSNQRAIQIATSMNAPTVNRILKTDHSVIFRSLPALMPTLSSACTSGSNQPRTCSASTPQTTNVMVSPQPLVRLPSETRTMYTPRRISSMIPASVIAISTSRLCALIACSTPPNAATSTSAAKCGVTISTASVTRAWNPFWTSAALARSVLRTCRPNHSASSTATRIAASCSSEDGVSSASSWRPAFRSSSCIVASGSSLCVEVGDQLALQPRDLVLQHQFAFFQAPQLHFVDVQVHLQPVDDVVQVAMLDAQLPQPLQSPERLGLDLVLRFGHRCVLYATAPRLASAQWPSSGGFCRSRQSRNSSKLLPLPLPLLCGATGSGRTSRASGCTSPGA